VKPYHMGRAAGRRGAKEFLEFYLKY